MGKELVLYDAASGNTAKISKPGKVEGVVVEG
jgi:hypothetical protein